LPPNKALQADHQQLGSIDLAHARRGRARHGRGKYTLWTGDGGFAVFLHHVLRQQRGPAASPLPGLEIL